MEIRFARVPAFVACGIVFFLGFILQVLRSTAHLARPAPAFKFLAALAAIGLLVNIPGPANALITPTASVGATPGSFAISPLGAATYTIPIVVSPGTNGMQPNFALVYNSQAGNGLLGMGWSLAGLSVIHLCGATIEIDGFKGGVNYDANDRFCLDGERLIHLGNNHYRTHRESLQKIEAIGGTATNPASFTVRDPSGTVREYALPIEAAGNSSIRRLWALSKVTDPSGNYLTIAYDKTDVALHGDYRPSSVSYTGNDSAGVAAYNSVVFDYINRLDVVPFYESGFVIKTLKLLSKVTVYAGDIKVREYRLSYDANGAMARSRIVSMVECGTDNRCLPATSLAWSGEIGGFGDLNLGSWGSSGQRPLVHVGDYNGDGKTDVLYLLEQPDTSYNWRLRVYDAFAGLDLLISIENGFGVTRDITHSLLTDFTVYTRDNNAAYPYQDVQDATYVVSSVSTSDGIGGTNTTTYRYGGLKKHHRADALLGFRWIRMTDPAGLVHITHYNQNREQGLDGTVAATEVYVSGTRIKRVTNAWVRADNVCGGRSQPQLTANTEETRELNNILVTQVTTTHSYDTCGFPTTTAVGFNDGFTKTVTHTYLPHDTANWRLGLISRAQVTAEALGQGAQTRVSSFSYTASGLLQTETIEPERPNLTLTTTYGYDAFGNRTSKTVSGADIATRTDTQAYDAQGRFPTSKTNALGHTTTFAHDARNGQPTRMADPNGLVTTWDYDGFGRKGLEVRPDGTRTTITYSAITGGYATFAENAGTAAIETHFDMLEREVRRGTVGFGGRWIYQRTQYDALGRVIFTSHPAFSAPSSHAVTYGYDILGRVMSVTTAGPGNRTTTTSYNGLTTTVTNPLSQVTTTVKNSQGKAVSVTDAAGTTSYVYDPFLNLTEVTDAANNVTTMTYDIRGRKTTMREPNLGTWSYSHNVLNEHTSQRDAKGQTVTMDYDLLGRLKTRTVPEGTSTWSYDTATKGIGKLASLSGPNGYQEQYVYDAVSRPAQAITTIGGANFIVSHGYDGFGRLKTITYPSSGYTVEQEYDDFGHLWKVQRLHDNGAKTLIWMTDDADAHNRIVWETFGNLVTSRRFYDPATTDLTAIKTGTGGTNTQNLQNLAYSFDAIGNLKTRADAITALNEAFEYDDLNRLTQATGAVTKTYQYNAIGNITYKSDVGTYSYNPSGPNSVRPHAVTAVSGTVNATYTYDANGNLLSGAGRSITYTSFNKPASISANGQTTSLSYDPNYNRIQKVSGDKTTVYIGKLYERVTAGTLVEHKHYVYGSGNLVAIHTSRNNNTADTQYVHTDHLGSVSVLTNDSGQVIARLSFDPHGKRRQTNGQDWSGPSSALSRGFTGHEHDEEVGLINMNARLYDPLLGRFISPDTIVARVFGQGLNRYSYVRNNPLSRIDPTGRWSLRKAFKRLKKNVARMTTRVLKKVGGINYVGGLANIGIMTNLSFGAAYGWSTGDWKSVGQAHAAGAVITVSYWAGGLAAAEYNGGFLAGLGYMGSSAANGYVTSYTMARIYGASNAEAKAIGWGSAKWSAAITSLDIAAQAMREQAASWARKNGANTTGESAGVRGDNIKLAGDYPDAVTGACGAPPGGCQGGPGTLFGKSYEPGGVVDFVLENFAGSHDFLDAPLYHIETGTLRHLTGLGKYAGWGYSTLTIPIAAPFGFASMIAPYQYALNPALEDILP